MDLDIRQNGNVCTLQLKGPLKMGDPVNQFDNAVRSAFASGHIFLVLDLEAMPYVDSCGIGAIVNALRESTKLGGDTKLVNPSPFATKTFKMIAILNLFTVYTTEENAVAACVG
ncbi:MAG: STAS domain-containing protein [Silvibacterium sp.]